MEKNLVELFLRTLYGDKLMSEENGIYGFSHRLAIALSCELDNTVATLIPNTAGSDEYWIKFIREGRLIRVPEFALGTVSRMNVGTYKVTQEGLMLRIKAE
jgi:hypothetical protein